MTENHDVTEYRLKRLEDDFKEISGQLNVMNGMLTGIQVQLATNAGSSSAKDGMTRTWVAPVLTAVLASLLVTVLAFVFMRGGV